MIFEDSHVGSVLLARLRRQLYDGRTYSEYRSRIDGGNNRRYDDARYNRRYDDRYYDRGYDGRNWRENNYDTRINRRTDLCGRYGNNIPWSQSINSSSQTHDIFSLNAIATLEWCMRVSIF